MIPWESGAGLWGATVSLLDTLTEPVILTDADGVVTHANPAALERLGTAKYIGLPFADQADRHEALTPDGQPLAPTDHPVARALATGEPISGVRLLIRPPDLRGSTYEIDTVVLRDGGRVVGAASVFHEATSASRLETDLVQRVARLEATLSLVSDAVYLVDRDERLVFENPAAKRLSGRTRDRAPEGPRWSPPLRDADGQPSPPDRCPWMRALAGATIEGENHRLVDVDGNTRHVVASAYPLRRPDGVIDAALVAIKDVTDQVRAREEQEAARAAFEEASDLKDQFIAALSHELRTPLQPILGWTEVLKRHGTLDPMTTQAVEAIRRNIRQQVRLVDDLLDLSRIVHGRLALRFEIFDLREQIRAAAEPLEETAALKRVKLTLVLPDDPAPMWGDGARIQQIASNLISNAVKFTAAGGQVTAQLVVSGTEALLEVEDTGAGIAPEELAMIFEAFRQGSAARRRGGLGIGLDLVKRLVELHGGTVEAFSEGRGYGARLSVRLPRRLREARTGAPGARRLEHHDIVLIEDNADTREVMKFILEAEGARVHTAEAGEEGLALARQVKPHVILCDIGLPDIDGLEVARRLRSEPALGGARLVALTGYGQPEDVRTALEAGFEAHFTKPINLDQLLALLGET